MCYFSARRGYIFTLKLQKFVSFRGSFYFWIYYSFLMNSEGKKQNCNKNKPRKSFNVADACQLCFTADYGYKQGTHQCDDDDDDDDDNILAVYKAFQV
ncbi:hypothetical protein PoB_002296300 [Plakobranchus ocellatus]|uniref:Uncharacterized protein n=1 Tax=Plakobranchus ocellatus TaxID=259542 RepID=A0AAV3ZPR9_9GAST|nr:hypothetical protein PoB_002296300 [Plakobranchus ocellatus]